MDDRLSCDEQIMPLGEWAQSLPVILDGKPFTFDKHEYLIEPYQDDHHHVVEIKAAQMGLSTKGMCGPFTAPGIVDLSGSCICSRAGRMYWISPVAG